MSLFEEMSFREKSILASLFSVLFVYGGYFAGILSGDEVNTIGAMSYAMIGVVISLVVVEVVLHIVIAAFDTEGAESADDERDLLISGRASRISQVLLSTGMVLVLISMLMMGIDEQVPSYGPPTLFEVANLLLFFLVFSEAVHYGAQVYYYRRGI